MSDRTTPYLGFNFIVALTSGGGTDAVGGFSDVSGLNNEITVAEYRAGNFAQNHTSKFPAHLQDGRRDAEAWRDAEYRHLRLGRAGAHDRRCGQA